MKTRWVVAAIATLRGCAKPGWCVVTQQRAAHTRGSLIRKTLIKQSHVHTFTTVAYWHSRGLCRLTDSVLRRSLHLLAGEPLHSASSPRCSRCMPSNGPLFGPVLAPNALPLQQLPLAATETWPWNPLWFCPLLTWKGPVAPFLSIIDLALSMAEASLA